MRMATSIALALMACAFAAMNSSLARPPSNSPNIQSARATDTARVQAEIQIGRAAYAKQDYAAAAAAYRSAIEMDPQNADAHKQFIEASVEEALVGIVKLENNPDYEKLKRGKLHGRAKKAVEAERKRAKAHSKAGDDTLLATYDQWIAAHPKTAVFYWAKGYALSMLDKVSGPEPLFQKAISLDPEFVPAYNSMAQIEFLKGDYTRQREYLKHVTDLVPGNPEAAFALAETFQFSDPLEFRQLAENYTNRFPNDEDCPYLLYQVENAEPTKAERIAVLEAIRRNYLDNPISTATMDNPDVFTNSLEMAMLDLFNLYALNNPDDALDLAQEMQKEKWASEDWKPVVAYQQNLMKAETLIAAAKYSDAKAVLQRPVTGWFVERELDHTPENLAKAEALAADGNVQQAFETLSAAWIKAPDQRLKAALLNDGAKLGKTPEQVDKDIWQEWIANAKEMKPFKLTKMDEKKKVTLSDFRGKVVLVIFWFPFCGPCRTEIPYLDEVAKKYQSQGFVIVAINGMPAQDGYARGVLKNPRIIGLRVPSDTWAEKYDHVQSYPTNYLLDSQGRIMAHPDARSIDAVKKLEMQIDMLLAHRPSTGVFKANSWRTRTIPLQCL